VTERFAEVADGVLRMGTPLINWYLVAEDDGVILVDAGAPRYRSQLEPGLAQLGRDLGDVRAVVLTHGDADHKGFAERLRRDHGVPVYVHAADEELTRTGRGRKREAGFLPYLRHRATWRLMAEFVRGGFPVHVQEVETYVDGEAIDVPGRPRAIHAPGHSPGCVALHFEARSLLFVGDVLFEYNVLTGRRGPQIGPAGFNESSEEALASLARLQGVEAETILFGHGAPWRAGVEPAIEAARAAGTRRPKRSSVQTRSDSSS
jgi:glyoxylase-like metal-dependent hydrolase (beta-lactamase superfamily II)